MPSLALRTKASLASLRNGASGTSATMGEGARPTQDPVHSPYFHAAPASWASASTSRLAPISVSAQPKLKTKTSRSKLKLAGLMSSWTTRGGAAASTSSSSAAIEPTPSRSRSRGQDVSTGRISEESFGGGIGRSRSGRSSLTSSSSSRSGAQWRHDEEEHQETLSVRASSSASTSQPGASVRTSHSRRQRDVRAELRRSMQSLHDLRDGPHAPASVAIDYFMPRDQVVEANAPVRQTPGRQSSFAQAAALASSSNDGGGGGRRGRSASSPSRLLGPPTIPLPPTPPGISRHASSGRPASQSRHRRHADDSPSSVSSADWLPPPPILTLPSFDPIRMSPITGTPSKALASSPVTLTPSSSASRLLRVMTSSLTTLRDVAADDPQELDALWHDFIDDCESPDYEDAYGGELTANLPTYTSAFSLSSFAFPSPPNDSPGGEGSTSSSHTVRPPRRDDDDPQQQMQPPQPAPQRSSASSSLLSLTTSSTASSDPTRTARILSSASTATFSTTGGPMTPVWTDSPLDPGGSGWMAAKQAEAMRRLVSAATDSESSIEYVGTDTTTDALAKLAELIFDDDDDDTGDSPPAELVTREEWDRVEWGMAM